MSRVGLGRHGQLDSDAGDPLDGLVNMFDMGLVLAVAFLVAGLSIGHHANAQKQPQHTTEQALQKPAAPQQEAGKGHAVGQVYMLPNGRLVLVRPKSGAP
jgi:hypothetical protein